MDKVSPFELKTEGGVRGDRQTDARVCAQTKWLLYRCWCRVLHFPAKNAHHLHNFLQQYFSAIIKVLLALLIEVSLPKLFFQSFREVRAITITAAFAPKSFIGKAFS